MTVGGVVDVADLPPAILAPAHRSTAFVIRERRRQLADHLYAGLVNGTLSFWNQIYRLFLNRDITRNDIRELLRKGLITTRGNYRALVKLFGMDAADYKRFLDFIAAHQCGVDAKIYKRDRSGESLTPEPPMRHIPPVFGDPPGSSRLTRERPLRTS
jgi:hypothetical protein